MQLVVDAYDAHRALHIRFIYEAYIRMQLESQALDLGLQLPDLTGKEIIMKIRIVVHDAEEGGYWAEVPAIPGCASQGETMDELMVNLREAIEGCLAPL